MKNTAILLLSCPDRKGVVAAIADFIYRHNGNILHADEHGDLDSGMFQMRVEFDPVDFSIDLAEFSKPFLPIAQKFEMHWRLAQSSYRPRMIILVSKHDHCLVDLLYRHKSGELACDIPLIISNHPDNQPIAEFYCIPYITVPVPKDNKCEAEQKILDLLKQHSPDFIVLARYMQILTEGFVARYPNRIINIHHSFLPAFAGAKPYQRAHSRGVKIIGATSHYVTAELDAGPIIEQEVIRVNHKDSADDMVRKGKDVEKMVLSRAIRYHLQNQVLIYNNKTVIFA